jgi:hypothetical protein
MPSVFTSMNQAGQDTLLQMLQRREFEQQIALRQMASMGDIAQQQQNAFFRQETARRADESAARQRERDALADKRNADKDALDAADRAKKQRDETNARGAQEMFIASRASGAAPDDPALLRAALDGKVPVSLMPRVQTPRPTLEEKVAEAKALTLAREEAKAPFKTPKATKVAKDNPKVPSGFRDAIQGRVGSAGFKTADEAVKSVQGRWPAWRQNYPGLDLNAVRSAIQNIYGQRVSGGGTDAIAQAVMAALAEDKDDQ